MRAGFAMGIAIGVGFGRFSFGFISAVGSESESASIGRINTSSGLIRTGFVTGSGTGVGFGRFGFDTTLGSGIGCGIGSSSGLIRAGFAMGVAIGVGFGRFGFGFISTIGSESESESIGRINS